MSLERVGNWQLGETLGSGGMGHVYLAQHVETGAKAAVKVLSASLAREPGFVERFHREIDALRKLSNPHIVQLIDCGVEGENYFYVMEYVEGETLLALMRRERRVPWRRAVEIALQVCQALKSAHDTGIIHRDLKPSNLLITPEGTVKLTDFGVAQVFASQRLTVTGGIIGTAEYMSPEQAQGKRAGKQSDLYSLGVVLYAMITGRTPFSGSTAVEVIQKHKFGLFDRPSLFAHDLPERIEETICKLLEKEPGKRFPDALVLQRHLEQVLRQQDFAAGTSGVTLADAAVVEKDATTVAATSASGERSVSESLAGGQRPGPATMMQAMMRAELSELERGHWLSALLNTLSVQIALLLLVIGGGVWWFWPKSTSADSMFEAGVALMQADPGPDWLRARREYFDPLLERDPQQWREKIEPYLTQIRLYELTRPQRGLARRSKNDSRDAEPLRFLQLAQLSRQAGDYVRAERTLAALEGLLAGSSEHEETRKLAGRLRDEIRKERPDLSQRDELLRQALTRAEGLARSGDVDQARSIWAGLVQLYADDSSAAQFVEQARTALHRASQTDLESQSAREGSGDSGP